MRLLDREVSALVQSLEKELHGVAAELRLYGSRLDDSLKGGDIDLLLLVKDEQQVKKLRERKHYLLAAIKAGVGEQKIDLLIASPGTIETDSFLQTILPVSRLLHQF